MSDDETPRQSNAAPPEPAKPVYDQAFFLDLARPKPGETQVQVRERWNAWRRDPANEKVLVTFEGVDFRTEENRGISFVRFEFGDQARFSEASFRDGVQFDEALFGSWVSFRAATFEGNTFFWGAKFDGGAFFTDVKFGNSVHFSSTYFGDSVSFDGSIFGSVARFDRAKFGRNASFFGASFGTWMWFDDTHFEDNADFSGVVEKRRGEVFPDFGEGDLKGSDRRRAATVLSLRDAEDLSRMVVMGLTFARAEFRGEVSFARRSFSRLTNFTDVFFERPPNFDGATNLERVNFTGARVRFVPADRPWWKPNWTTDSTVAIRLRTLRSQVEATKNHDFERDLYIEERKAERGIYFDRYLKERRWAALAPHCLWIGVMAGYWAFSDYGRSWLRPATWLAASIPAFHLLYAHLLADRRDAAVAAAREAVTKTGEGKDALVVVKGWQVAEARVLADYDATVGQLAVSNAVPFVGPLTIDGDAKKFLYCGVWPTGKGETIAGSVVEPCRPIPPPGFQAAMISQNLLSILLVFFIGLALRNYFRVK